MSVLYFLLMVGVLVTVHELGHFIAAKLVGVKVLRFSVGFGPALVRLRGRETEYRLGAIPLGGYVKLLGEGPRDEVPEDERERSFSDKPLGARLFVVFAGPAANLLCPLLIYFAFFLQKDALPAAVIGDVLRGGAAAAADLRPGDRVIEIDGASVRYWEEVEERVDAAGGRTLRLKVIRDGKPRYAYVAPKDGLIGVTQGPFAPVVGVVDPASPAARAGLATGDQIVSVDGRPVESYGALEAELGRSGIRSQVAYLRPRRVPFGFAEIVRYEPGLADLLAPRPTKGRTLGIAPGELFIAAVEPDSPAARAGLRVGDRLLSLDGTPVAHWLMFESAMLAAPDRTARVVWQRGRPGGGVEVLAADLLPERRRVVDEYGQSQETVVIGAHGGPRLGAGKTVAIDGRVAWAAGHAIRRTGETVALMARGFVSLIAGQLPSDAVGGPMMVYRMASVSGEKGWDAFLLMFALISINLGLLNLLPVPMLDGGHVLVFAVEAVRRRRLSPRVREGVVFAGLVLIVSLTVLALRNDIVRYLLR